MSPPSRQECFFAVCPPGFERVLLAEARRIKLPKPEAQPGGVEFHGTMRDARRANLWLRTASRVLLRLTRFHCRTDDDLYRGARKVDWERFLGPDGTLAVQARGRSPALRNTQFTERRVKDAVVDEFREKHDRRPSVDLKSPDLRINVRLIGDRVTILADTTGEPLFKRGWRAYQGNAPLKETLAAYLVLASGWDGRSPLLDPFCGSGTILIEAALIAGDIPPGIFRDDFGFMRWPEHDEAAWQREREEASEKGAIPKKLVLKGWDSDPRPVMGALRNIEAAGLGDRITIEQANADDFAPRKGWNAWIVTNPPYGERIGRADKLRALFHRFGEILREHCGGYNVTVLSGHAALTKALGFTPDDRQEMRNGPIDCERLSFEIPRRD